MPRQYNRISSDDPNGSNSNSDNNANVQNENAPIRSPSTCSQASASSVSSSTNPANKNIGQRISDKFHAAAWVLFALFVVRCTDTPRVILSTPKPDFPSPLLPLLHFAIAQLTVNFILLLYLGLYLPQFKGIKDPEAWSVYCPRVIPVMTTNGVLCAFTLIRSLWPVWGFLTPFILGIEAMGLLFSMHFVPWLSN